MGKLIYYIVLGSVIAYGALHFGGDIVLALLLSAIVPPTVLLARGIYRYRRI